MGAFDPNLQPDGDAIVFLDQVPATRPQKGWWNCHATGPKQVSCKRFRWHIGSHCDQFINISWPR